MSDPSDVIHRYEKPDRTSDLAEAIEHYERSGLIPTPELATLLDAARRVLEIREVVNEQAEDEGLWFHARTAPEAYLQQELRRLHAVIEEGVGDE